MLAELTLLTNFALLHLVVAFILWSLVSSVVRFSRVSPETQSWLWCTVFVVSTILPFSLFGESRETNVTPLTQVITTNALPQAGLDNSSAQTSQRLHKPTIKIPAEGVKEISALLQFLLGVWLMGSSWRLYTVARSFWHSKRLLSHSTPCFPIEQEWAFTTPILSCGHASTPMAMGFIRPVIIVPTKFLSQLTPRELFPVLLHEQAHIQRRDVWMSTFQECLAIVFWWSPMMRLINHKIHITRELACDLRATAALNDKKRYAQALLDCTRIMLRDKHNPMALGLFSKKKDLEYRVTNVLTLNQQWSHSMFKTLFVCSALTATTYLAAALYAPKISVAEVKRNANHFSELSPAKSELLIDAIEARDMGMIEMMINNGLDINTPILGDGTALMIAVKNRNLDLVQQLLALGADVNQSSQGDGNPLIVAAQVDNTEIATLLLNEGADINAVVPGDETALIKASWEGHFDMVELLVQRGADVNLGVNVRRWGEDEYEYRTPLNKANSQKIKDFLVSAGAVE